ncbi:MAG: M23 family metallopeptidase [Elusimicrobiota bacterium]
MKIIYSILILISILPSHLYSISTKPFYDELLITKLDVSTQTDYDFVKQLDELVLIDHTVRKNETLQTIARKYGTDAATIRGINNLEITTLKPNQKILVINKKGYIHTIKKNETLNTISKKYKISAEIILVANDFEDEDEIEFETGRKLFIPGVKIQFAEFIWPVVNCRITSRFGLRRHPIFRDKRFHEGLDLARWYGAPVRAASNGKVIFAGREHGYGKMVIIRHKNGFSTRYGHLRSYFVKKGQFVKAEQTIGRIGSSGYSTGPHLHFEIRKYGRPMNPLKYLRNQFIRRK